MITPVRLLWLMVSVGVPLLPAQAADLSSRPPFDSGPAPFAVDVRGDRVPYRLLLVAVLPGESLPVSVAKSGGERYLLEAPAGEISQRHREGRWRWSWKAPTTPGALVPLAVVRQDGARVRLNAFVMVPAGRVKHGVLNGYRIGSYPDKPLRGLSIYRPPQGFIEVTEENRDTLVSPHFTLGQFLCKQAGGYPKYLALRERLLLKLEYLLEVVNDHGVRADSFFVMSGFRTPAYNTAIDNVRYSRHQWGGAADIFIDEDRDGVMDDLNGDGKVTGADADFLYDLFDSLQERDEYADFIGGLGRYGATANHGPFVHVDARGFKARWGR